MVAARVWSGHFVERLPLPVWLLVLAAAGVLLALAALLWFWPAGGPADSRKLSRATRSRPAFQVRQQMVRGRTAAGQDVLVGRVCQPLHAGQRTAVTHVSFCPPFAGPPQLTVRQMAGPAARVKVGPLWPHGARLEIKLASAATKTTTVTLALAVRG